MPLNIASSPFIRRIDRQVLDYVRRRACLLAGERVIVGVSGGPDSTALLLILWRLAKELGVSLAVGHFDHKLRSREEAAADQRFVASFCRKLGLPLATGEGKVRQRAKRNGESLEDAARKLRYQFLGAEANARDAAVVAVGHTLDDRAETVLLHILRGSGVAGLGAMTPRSAWPFGDGPDIVRPLLELRREDTEQYCRESGVQPRHDPTNDLPVATRNRVRHELMPALRQFNPRVEEALARLADAAALDDDFVELVADRDWTALASATRERVTFPRLAFASFHPAVQARLLMRAAEKLGGADASLTSGHVDEVRFALDRRASRLSLPGGLVCAIGSQRISITRGAEKKLTPAPETVLAVPGKVSWGHWTIIATKASGRLPKKISHDEAYLAKAAVKGSLLVRARQPGDRLRPLGLRGEKKVQDILVDAKVSEEERDAVPIVCDDAGVIWIAGHRLAERAAVRKAGEMVHLRVARRRAPRR